MNGSYEPSCLERAVVTGLKLLSGALHVAEQAYTTAEKTYQNYLLGPQMDFADAVVNRSAEELMIKPPDQAYLKKLVEQIDSNNSEHS